MRQSFAMLAAALFAAFGADAADLIVEVPVRVADVHRSVRVASMVCTVFSDPAGPSSGTGRLGTGSVQFALEDGAFSGKVDVPVIFDSGTKGRAQAYRCGLHLLFAESGGRTRSIAVEQLARPDAPDYRENFRHAPGAPFVPEVVGRIP